MEFDIQKGTEMGDSCDCIGSCEHLFEARISTLEGLVDAIKHDDDHIFSFRANPERPRPYTNPPKPRRWSLFGTSKQRPGQGFINTWDLKDQQGENLGFCYTEGGGIGIPLERVEKSTMTTYDPPDSCDRIITEVHIVRISALDDTSREEIYRALRRLVTITPA